MNSIAHLKGKKAVVLGLGISGRSAVRFLLENGVDVNAVDNKADELRYHPEVISFLDKGMSLSETAPLHSVDFLVVSPGVPSNHPCLEYARARQWEILGEIELACRYLPHRMLGITGTNGKTTVTLLTTHVLNAAGIPARALGNSGVPLTTALDPRSCSDADDVFVLELSSYQLETLSAPCLDAAVILNITPDHLDRYAEMEAYAKAKFRIQECLKPGAPLFVQQNCAELYKAKDVFLYGYHPSCLIYSDLSHVFYKQKMLFSLPEHLLRRETHDVENLMAAYALCRQMGVSEETFIEAYSTFNKPPHRLEFVRRHKGISYINDSKGTNLDAVIKAVKAVEGGIILIAGGVDKGASYAPWISAFSGRVRCVCAIGQAAEKIEKELGEDIPIDLYPNLEAAVRAASLKAQNGETVLLSPGCSSFDMFKDYSHRGDEFKRLVLAL